jgi:hypothetical protein
MAGDHQPARLQFADRLFLSEFVAHFSTLHHLCVPAKAGTQGTLLSARNPGLLLSQEHGRVATLGAT